MASYRDIAKLTGLSYGTISNVLQGKSSVKEENREKVNEAIKKLDYRVNYQARGLASGKTHLIGLVVSNIENAAESKILMSLESFAETIHSRVIWATSRNDKEREKRNCEAILGSEVDVLFVFFQSLENEEYFRFLARTERTPIIFLARYLDHCNLPYVAVDNNFAATEMVQYVYEKGHKKICYLDIAAGAMLSPNRSRRLGVIEHCKKLGIECEVKTYPMLDDDITVGYKAAEEMILTNTLPKLVFPRDDSFAVGFYSACTKYGVRVPEDVSMMSFGNFYPQNITPKRLATFDRHFDRVIAMAGDLYLKISAERENGAVEGLFERKIFVRGELIEGETVADITQES